MISFSIAPKLLALCFLLILYTSADDSDLTDPPLAQKTAAGFSPSLSDGALGSVGNQPIIENEGSLGQLSDTLIETPKSLLLTDSESTNCAGSPDVPHKRSRRSSRGLGKRQQHDFCSVQDPEKLKLAPPSEPRADDIPAGQQGKAGIGRPRGSMGGPDGFIPDPMLNLKESQLYGNPNPALCPNGNMNVPVCTPYDQKFTSPAPILVPSRFCKRLFISLSPFPTVISLGLVSQKYPSKDSTLEGNSNFGEIILTGRLSYSRRET